VKVVKNTRNKENKMSSKKTYSYKEAKFIGEKLAINWNKFDVEQFRMGMDVELEHGKINELTNEQMMIHF